MADIRQPAGNKQEFYRFMRSGLLGRSVTTRVAWIEANLSPTSNMRVDQEPGRSRSPYFYENPLRVNDDSWGYFTFFPSLKGFLGAQRWLPFVGQCGGHRAPGRFPIFYPSFSAVGEVPKWVLREAVAAPSENELHVVPKYRPSSPPPAFSGRLLDADEITSVSWLRRPR